MPLPHHRGERFGAAPETSTTALGKESNSRSDPRATADVVGVEDDAIVAALIGSHGDEKHLD